MTPHHKILIATLAAVLAPHAMAQERFLLDFGPSSRLSPSTTPDALGRKWNNLTAQTVSTTPMSLVNTSGEATSGLTFSVIDDFAFTSANGHASTSAPYPYSASSDFWALNKTNTTGEIRIGGLDTTGTKVYDITLFGSSNRALPQKLIADYTVSGVTSGSASLEAVANTANTVTISGI